MRRAEALVVTAGGYATLTNSLLVKDSANAATVFGSDSGSRIALVNSTIVGGNHGVALDQNAHLDRLVNSIVAFHSVAGVALTHGGTASTDVRNNDVYNPGATIGNYMNMQDYTGQQGNVSADPRFVNRAAGDYRLGDGSAAVDAADGDVAPLRDRDGLPRFDDWGVPDTGGGTPGYIDMGCHERVSDSTSPIDLIVVADSITGPETVTTGETVTVHWTIQNTGTEPAVGPWHDQVSLVRDPLQNPVAIAAGEVLGRRRRDAPARRDAGGVGPGRRSARGVWAVRVASRNQLAAGSSRGPESAEQRDARHDAGADECPGIGAGAARGGSLRRRR